MTYHTLLQEFVNVHQNHEETRCSYISTASTDLCDKTWVSPNASDNTTTNAFNASMTGNITVNTDSTNEIINTSRIILNGSNLNPCHANDSVSNPNWNSSMCIFRNDSSSMPCRTNASDPNITIL